MRTYIPLSICLSGYALSRQPRFNNTGRCMVPEVGGARVLVHFFCNLSHPTQRATHRLPSVHHGKLHLTHRTWAAGASRSCAPSPTGHASKYTARSFSYGTTTVLVPLP
jgi:hypothetical protein